MWQSVQADPYTMREAARLAHRRVRAGRRLAIIGAVGCSLWLSTPLDFMWFGVSVAGFLAVVVVHHSVSLRLRWRSARATRAHRLLTELGKARASRCVLSRSRRWLVLSPLAGNGLFAVVDRIGETANLEEHWFDSPYQVVGQSF